MLWIEICCLLFVGCNAFIDASPEEVPVTIAYGPPEALAFIAWNAESGGSDPDVIAEQLSEFSDYDVIALSEVSSASFDQFQSAAGNSSEP